MNPTKKDITHAEGDRLDRLVDGELTEPERRSLLASLDTEPESWRRCALAFLEAQAWRESIGELTPPAHKPSALPAPVALPVSLKKRKKPLGAMGTVMAMAASFLLTLGLGGWIFHGPRGDFVTPTSNQFAGNGNPSAYSRLPTVSAGGNDTIRQPIPSASTPWQTVQLQAPGLTGDNKPLRLPAMQRERLDENFFNSVPSPLPDEVRKAFERMGRKVRTTREFVPVTLKDGRQLIIPVDQIDVQDDEHQTN